MPSLGKHDALAYHYVTLVEEIEAARAQNEVRVETSLGLLALTPETRSRLEAVNALLDSKDDSDAIVEWVMDDKSKVQFKKGGPAALLQEALALVGEKTQRSYVYAQELKAKFRSGQKVSYRDIAPEKWV